jgi:hypothetical protein
VLCCCLLLLHSCTHSLTHSLTHLLTHSLRHCPYDDSNLFLSSLAHCTHSRTVECGTGNTAHSLTHALTHSLIYSLTYSLTHSLTHSGSRQVPDPQLRRDRHRPAQYGGARRSQRPRSRPAAPLPRGGRSESAGECVSV